MFTASEEVPLIGTDRSIEEAHTMTRDGIVTQKDELLSRNLGFADDGKPVVIQERPDEHACLRAMRDTCCFRVCIAHNPETRLNELHILQPVLLVFVVVGCALLLLGPALHDSSLQTVTTATIGLLALSSVLLFAIGRVAASIPPLEDQVATLVRDEKIIEAGKDKEVAIANQAAHVNDLTLSIVHDARQERRSLSNMRQTFVVKYKVHLRLLYKAKVIAMIWDAEYDAYADELRKKQRLGDPNPVPPPNGAVTVHELEILIQTLRNRGTDFEFIDDILERNITNKHRQRSSQTDTEFTYADLIDTIMSETKKHASSDDRFVTILDEMGLSDTEPPDDVVGMLDVEAPASST